MQIFSFLLYALLLANVLMKFFTNLLHVVPRVFNIADLMITAILGLMFFATGGRIKNFKSILVLLFLFDFVAILGNFFNSEYLFPMVAFSQFAMYNGPIILFVFLANIPFRKVHIDKYSKLLYNLIYFQFIVGLLQIPVFLATGQTEAIMGTFYHNAEQYSGFLLIGIFFLFSKSLNSPQFKQNYYILIASMLSLIVIIDNKASWLGIIISMLYIFYKVGDENFQVSKRFKYIILAGTMLTIGGYLITSFSQTTGKLEGLITSIQEGMFNEIGKVKAYDNVFKAFDDHPHMLVFGAGLGNFYSRSSYTYYDPEYYGAVLSHSSRQTKRQLDRFKTESDKLREKGKTLRTSNSMGGVIDKMNQEPFFAQYYKVPKLRVGSGQVDNPFSSYNALLGETGILGMILYISIYIIILIKMNKMVRKYRKDTNIFPIAASGLGFMVYILSVALYGQWIDSGRMVTILWSLIALTFRYDLFVQWQKKFAYHQHIRQRQEPKKTEIYS